MSNHNNKDREQTQLSDQGKVPAPSTAAAFGKMLGRTLLTVLVVFLAMLAALVIGLCVYINSYMNETLDIDLHNLSLDYTSFIYTTDADGNVKQAYTLYSGDNNRVWVDFENIPQQMKDAMVAIEDKRFYEHKGVDWTRTLGAVTALGSGNSYGGSTLTQQLIKNLTGDNEVSINRKVKEIFRALNMEKQYTKEEILEAYLNVVNFGSGTKGVQAAANLYFNKDISECDIAECAAIAGITQNPTAYNPLVYPEANKERQQTVIQAMYDQGMISSEEYDAAMEESENMKFYGIINGGQVGEVAVFDWYTEAVITDVMDDLVEKYGCTTEEASNMIYYNGLKIYSAVDVELQNTVENIFATNSYLEEDPDLEAGFYMMDYNGRVLAIIGSTDEKTGNRWMSNATDARRQVGSTMKAISVYTPAMENGFITYSTAISDEAIANYFDDGSAGPNNWYSGSRGNLAAWKALEISSNRAAANLCKIITPQLSYKFMTENLHFTTLTEADSRSISAMALGGMTDGLTVKEMTAAFQIFGNSGQYYKPCTYYYVEDSEGNVILDNRDNIADQAVSAGTAETMNKMLQGVVSGSEGTGTMAAISGWEVYGKTGTTDDNVDSWFMGGTPYAIAGIWTGYTEGNRSIANTNTAKALWKAVMEAYLEDKPEASFTFDNITQAYLCTSTGKVASSGCSTEWGWIAKDRLEDYCNGDHTLYRGGSGDYDDEDDDDYEEPEQTEPEEDDDEPAASDEPEEPSASEPEEPSAAEPEEPSASEPETPSSTEPEEPSSVPVVVSPEPAESEAA